MLTKTKPSAEYAEQLIAYLPTRPNYNVWINTLSALLSEFSPYEAERIALSRFHDEFPNEHKAKLRQLQPKSFGCLVNLAKENGYKTGGAGCKTQPRPIERTNNIVRFEIIPLKPSPVMTHGILQGRLEIVRTPNTIEALKQAIQHGLTISPFALEYSARFNQTRFAGANLMALLLPYKPEPFTCPYLKFKYAGLPVKALFGYNTQCGRFQIFYKIGYIETPYLKGAISYKTLYFDLSHIWDVPVRSPFAFITGNSEAVIYNYEGVRNEN